MNFHKINLRFFIKNGSDLLKDFELRDFFPVFQSWIQKKALNNLLIDVADYAHVPEGPGILLVAHEANYATDWEGGRLGLLYARKQPLPGTPQEQLETAYSEAKKACDLLEAEPTLKGKIKFRDDELLIVLNDRLATPNTEETYHTIQPIVSEFLQKRYPGKYFTLTRDPNPTSRFSLTINVS